MTRLRVRTLNEYRIGHDVRVPRYEVDIYYDSREEGKWIYNTIKNAPRVGNLYTGFRQITAEVTSREARSKDEAKAFIKKLLDRAPVPFKERLGKFEAVVQVTEAVLSGDVREVDTRTVTPNDQHKLGSAAYAENHKLVAYHVTDDPSRVAAALKAGKKLTATYGPGRGRYNELGPGLYVSAAPNLWVARSVGKWDFLKRITPQEKKKLAAAILNDRNMKGNYLTVREKETVARDVRNFLDSSSPNAGSFIVGLAGQPYNIAFWRPEFLRPLGIEPAPQPEEVEVHIKGRFVDLSRGYGGLQSWRPYLMAGYDGAFVKGFDSQLVVWRNKAVVRFGSYYP